MIRGDILAIKTMKIDLYSSLRNIAGCKSLTFTVDGSHSLLDVLNHLAQEFPALQIMFFDQHGNLYDQMPVFLNGRNPRLLPEGLHTRVVEADILSLFTPIASGKINVEVLHQARSVDTPQESGNET